MCLNLVKKYVGRIIYVRIISGVKKDPNLGNNVVFYSNKLINVWNQF